MKRKDFKNGLAVKVDDDGMLYVSVKTKTKKTAMVSFMPNSRLMRDRIFHEWANEIFSEQEGN